jgi:hypothetical protein
MKFTRRDSATFFTSSLLIGTLTDVFVRQDLFGLNFLLWSLLWVSVMLIAAFLNKLLYPRFILFAVLAILNATLVYIRAEPVVQAWSSIITLISLLLMAGMLYADNFLKLPILNRMLEYLTGVLVHIKNRGKVMYALLVNKTDNSKTFKISSGLIIAFMLCLIFIGLFSATDAVFRQQFSFVGDFFSYIGEWLQKYNSGRIFTVIFWTMVSGAVLLILTGRDTSAKLINTPERKYFTKNDTSMILGAVCAIFALFSIIQLRYLFAGSSLPNNMTYAYYARRGYGELLLATMLASAVIYSSIAYTKEKAHTKLARVLSNVLVILNGFVILSAWKRLGLYEGAYGWTMTRFVARLGLICILLGSVLLLFWVNKRISTQKLFGFGWYAIASVLVIAALLNPIGIITHKNITERSQRDIPLDTFFVSQLSADSYPALCKYAPSLKAKYPKEYEALQNVAPNFNKLKKSRGLSAHHTANKAFIDKYNKCLK